MTGTAALEPISLRSTTFCEKIPPWVRLYGSAGAAFHAGRRPVDTTGMTSFELEELESVPDWRCVLAAYRDSGILARTQSAEFDGWLPRLTALDGLDSAGLSTVHGRLIALGFLRFQVGGRTVGLQYQLAPEGRHALESGVPDDSTTADFTDDELAEESEAALPFASSQARSRSEQFVEQ